MENKFDRKRIQQMTREVEESMKRQRLLLKLSPDPAKDRDLRQRMMRQTEDGR